MKLAFWEWGFPVVFNHFQTLVLKDPLRGNRGTNALRYRPKFAWVNYVLNLFVCLVFFIANAPLTPGTRSDEVGVTLTSFRTSWGVCSAGHSGRAVQ